LDGNLRPIGSWSRQPISYRLNRFRGTPALRVLAQAQRTDTVFDVVSLPERTSPGAPPPLSPSVMRRWFLEEPLLFRQQFLSVLSEDTGGDRLVASDVNLRDTFVES